MGAAVLRFTVGTETLAAEACDVETSMFLGVTFEAVSELVFDVFTAGFVF